MGHDGYLARGGRGCGARGDDLALGQWARDGDGMRDSGGLVGRRRRRGYTCGVRGSTQGLLGSKLVVIGAHRDLAPGAVIDGVDGSVITNSE